jgi:hypothetical protein
MNGANGNIWKEVVMNYGIWKYCAGCENWGFNIVTLNAFKTVQCTEIWQHVKNYRSVQCTEASVHIWKIWLLNDIYWKDLHNSFGSSVWLYYNSANDCDIYGIFLDLFSPAIPYILKQIHSLT